MLAEVASEWRSTHPAKITLRLIGAGALMLQTGYDRGTKDSDILETEDLDALTRAELLELAGPGTRLAKRWRMYVEFVPRGLTFLPTSPQWRAFPIANGRFTVEALDEVDVVVSKLKRFHANDRQDIAAMIERDLVPHPALVERFKSAVDRFSDDARAEELPRYVRNFHQVERDQFDAPETSIELPDWIDDGD